MNMRKMVKKQTFSNFSIGSAVDMKSSKSLLNFLHMDMLLSHQI